MSRERKPDCMDYVLKRLHIPYHYTGDITAAVSDLFCPAIPQNAHAVLVRIAGGIAAHIVPFDPKNPNRITHRPGPGRAVVHNQSFEQAVGSVHKKYISSRIEYLRKKDV